jgi:uncharacterized membrane protein
MIDFLHIGGPFIYLLVVIAGVVLWLAVKHLVQSYRPNDANRKSGNVKAILFWSCMALLTGVFAHFMGLYMAMQAIMEAADISPVLVAGGYAVSLSTIIFGMVILLLDSTLLDDE